MNTVRLLRPLSALALVGALSACGSAGGGPGEATTSPASSAPAAQGSVSTSTEEPTASLTTETMSPEPSASSATGGASSSATNGVASGEPSPGTGGGEDVSLTQKFTTPDGTISFGYPADWTVREADTSTAELPLWDVTDAKGVRVLTLSIRPDGQIVSPATPQNPATVATLPDALDAQGDPLVVGVGPFPGQSQGVNMSNVYAVTSGSGADRVFGYVSRGDGTTVSFEGAEEGGINDQVDMADETQKFLQSSRFRHEILPVLRSFTMKPAAG